MKGYFMYIDMASTFKEIISFHSEFRIKNIAVQSAAEKLENSMITILIEKATKFNRKTVL